MISCGMAGTWVVHPSVQVDSPALWHSEAAGDRKGLITCAQDTVPTTCMHSSFGPWLLLV